MSTTFGIRRSPYISSSVSGTDVEVQLELLEPNVVWNDLGYYTYTYKSTSTITKLNNLISLSYSVYRQREPLFILGKELQSGNSFNYKYVAGSIILNNDTFFNEYLSDLINKKSEDDQALIKNEFSLQREKIYANMDDFGAFNIRVSYTNEYSNTGDNTGFVISEATFLNEGKVMSVHDLITESTVSYVAKNIEYSNDKNYINNNLNFTDKKLKQKDTIKNEFKSILNNKTTNVLVAIKNQIDIYKNNYIYITNKDLIDILEEISKETTNNTDIEPSIKTDINTNIQAAISYIQKL